MALRDLDPVDPTAGYFAARSGANLNATWGVLELTVSDSELTGTFVRASGGTLTDSFSLTKGSSPAPPPPDCHDADTYSDAPSPTPTPTSPSPTPTSPSPTPTSPSPTPTTTSPTPTSTASPVTYLVSGATWRFNDSGANLGTAWRAPSATPSRWKSGPSQWGFGDGDERTVLTWGTTPNAKPMTNYGRVTFDAGSITGVTGIAARPLVGDAAAIYLNGAEVWRFNLPTGTISSTTGALRYIAGREESLWRTFTLPTATLQPGLNTVAVEVHQDVPSSSDILFDLELRPVR